MVPFHTSRRGVFIDDGLFQKPYETNGRTTNESERQLRDVDPLFVSTTDLRLQEGSLCIDTGSNDAVPDDVTTDLDGEPRIVDGNGDEVATVDMGAYELQP